MANKITVKGNKEGICWRDDRKAWEVRYTSDVTGKRASKYFGVKKLVKAGWSMADAKKAAKDEAEKWRKEAISKDVLAVKEAEQLTVDKLFYERLYPTLANKERNTVASYETRYRRNVHPVMGHMQIADVTGDECRKVLIRMDKDGYAAETMWRTYVVMYQLFRLAEDDGLLGSWGRSPVTASVRAICKDKAALDAKNAEDTRQMTPGELTALLAAAEGCCYYDEFLLVSLTGLRVGELCGLHWDDVDFDAGVIRVRRNYLYTAGAGGGWREGHLKSPSAKRDIPMCSAVRAMMQERYRHRHERKAAGSLFEGLVFLTSGGRPTVANNYNRKLEELRRTVGIDHLSIHSLRHAYATNCAALGVPVAILKALMGHRDIATTYNVYVHINVQEFTKQSAFGRYNADMKYTLLGENSPNDFSDKVA